MSGDEEVHIEVDTVNVTPPEDVVEQTKDVVPETGVALPEEQQADATEVPHKNRRFGIRLNPKLLTIVGISLIVLLNGGIGGASWYLHNHPKKKSVQQVTLPSGIKIDATNTGGLISLNNTTVNNDASVSTNATTSHYVSKAGGVEFDFPTDWRIDATSDDSLITITTAKFSYKLNQSDQNASTGTLQITIKKHAPTQVADFDIAGEGHITEKPITITYANPTKIQRKSTLLNTYRGITDPNEAYGIGVFISGSTVYAVGDKITSKDISKVDPLISMYVQLDCGVGDQSGCKYLNPGPISTGLFDSVATFQNAKKIIESLRFNQ